MPPSIDSTGGGDASASLTSFVASVPDGSTIVFDPNGLYRMDRGLELEGRRDLTFEGNGATLLSSGSEACARDCSLFYLRTDNVGITIRNFTLEGNSPTPGVYDPGWEHASAITAVAGGDLEISGVTIRGVGGDGLTLSGGRDAWPDGVWFHDSRVESAGRNGVAVIAGRDVTVERVAFDRLGYTVFDIEPNDPVQGAANVQLLHNSAGTWTNSFVSAEGAAGSSVSGITISGNTVTGGSLLTFIGLARRSDVIFTDNVSMVRAAGPVLRFAHIDGLTVTGNEQPLDSGALASINDCTDVTTE